MDQQDKLTDILDDLKKHFFTGDALEVTPQGGGYSTANNFKIECRGKCYLLRLFPESMQDKTFEKELALTKLAGEEGIGPKLRFVNQSLRMCLIDYIDGSTLMLSDLEDSDCIDSTVELLTKLHCLNTDKAFKADPLYKQQQQFLTELKNKDEWVDYFNTQGDLILQQRLDSDFYSSEALVHDDLNVKNIMKDSDKRLWFIDWTNAGYGSIYSDLSMLSSFMNEKGQEQLFAAYVKHSGMQLESERLNAYRLMRQFLGVTWALAQAQRASPDEALPLTVLKQPKGMLPLRDLLDSYLRGQRSLESKEDFLFLLSHYIKDYRESKEQLLGKNI